ncbi:hypothetical protein OC845_001604 [Tilletia horrida]|nr:hypothetical protein OC845_001604 [Tilletia horrida]
MLSTSAHSTHTNSTSPAASPAAQLHPQSASKTSDAASAAAAKEGSSASAPSADKEEVITCKWAGCTRTFVNADILYVHLCDDHVGRKSTNNLCLTCHWDDCDTTCAKRDHITSHLRVHIPLKPHLCHICSKSFKRPQDLKKHERIHPPQIGHPNFGTIGAPMGYHPIHHHQVPHPGMIPHNYPGPGPYPGMPAHMAHPGGPYPASSFYPTGSAPPPAGHQYYSNNAPTYSNMYAEHPGQSLYDNSMTSNTYAGLSGAGANRKRNHDQIAAVEDFFGQVANKRIAPTYDGAMINRLNDTLATFLEQQQEPVHQGQQAGGYPVSQFVGLPSNSADGSHQGSNSASLAAALHPIAQAHQAQLQAAVAGAAPASNPADLADFNAWLVQLGTDIARGGQRQLSQPNLSQGHQAPAQGQHVRAHSHGAADAPSSNTFDFVASLTQANLTQIPGVDASLFANTFTTASGDDSVGSLSVGGHSPAPLSTSSSSHQGLSSSSNESPFSFDALVPNRQIAQLPQRALHGGEADKFNTSFNSLAQPRSVPAGARSASGAMHVGSAATIPQLAPHFSTSLGNHGYPVSSAAASEGMFSGSGFPPTAYRRVEPLMRAAPQPGELLPSAAGRAPRSKSNDEDDSRSSASSSSSGSHRARSSSPSRSRSVTPSSTGAAAAQSSPVALSSLYPRTLTASEMAKRTLPPPNSTQQYGPNTAKLPSIRAILADRDSDEEVNIRPMSSSAALSESLRSATLSPDADADTRVAHLRLIIELLKALNQNQNRSRHGELRGSAQEAFSPESSTSAMDDEDVDSDDDERPLAQTSSHGRQRTAEEESAAAVLDGLRLARPSSAGADRGMDLDGQRTPVARSPSPSRAAAAASPVPAPAPRRVQGLKDLLNDVGVEPMKSRKRQPQQAEGMDLD